MHALRRVSESAACDLRVALTLRLEAAPVDTGTYDDDIVDDRHTHFAADPCAFAIPHAHVGQHSGPISVDALAVEFLGIGNLIFGKELPRRVVDNLIWGVAQDVDHRIRGIEDGRVVAEV